MAKILLVEDSEQIWDFLSRRLERRGRTVPRQSRLATPSTRCRRVPMCRTCWPR